jgi:hypothetical protein
VPDRGDGLLRALGAGGTPLRLRLDGHDLPGLRVRFGPGEFLVQVHPDGRLTVLDGALEQTAVRADRLAGRRRSGTRRAHAAANALRSHLTVRVSP